MTKILKSAFISIAMALVLASVTARAEVPKALQGDWVATRVVQDGKAAPGLVGHRLTFDGDAFRIVSKDGQTLFAGTAQADPAKKPAQIDFLHTDGDLKGKTWKGIYRISGSTLTVADNAPDLDKARPTSLAARRGSGHVLFAFTRAAK